MKKPIHVTKGALLIALYICFSSLVHAADIDVLDKQQITPPPPKSQPKMQIVDDYQPTVQDQTITFTLGSLHLENSTVFSEQELLAPYTGLYGKQVSFAAVYNIAKEMTARYRDNGYVLSQVVLPAQELDPLQAHIRLYAIEGYISSVEYLGDAKLVEQFKSYFSSVERKLLTIRPLRYADYEREMLLLQDLPGLKISTTFKKGSELGTMILVIQVDRKTVDAGIGWGNTGTKASGRGMFNAHVGISSLPLIGSHSTLAYTQADDFEEYHSVQIAQSLQLSSGLLLKASYMYSSSPEQDTEFARLFDYETQSHTFSLGAAYPFIRSRDMNLSIGASFDYRDSEADVLDERFTTDHLRSVSLYANFDFADTLVGDKLGGVTQIIPTLTQGLNIFNATDNDFDASNPMASANYIKANLYLSRTQKLPRDFSLLLAAEAQFSDSALSSYNKFSLGGSQFGRGYTPGTLEDDNAFAASLETRWTHSLNETFALQPFAFLDWGTVWSSEDVDGQPDDENLSSVGMGIRLWAQTNTEYRPNFHCSAYVGKPLKSAGGEGTDERYVLQLGMSF